MNPLLFVWELFIGIFRTIAYIFQRIFIRHDYLRAPRAMFLTFDYKRWRNGISALMEVDGDLTKEKAAEELLPRLSYKEFTHRIEVGDFTWPHFVKVKDFDPTSHCFETTLETGTYEEMLKAVNDVVDLPYDIKKPLWTVHLIRNYLVNGKKRTVVLLNIHHCLVDGFSCVRILFSVTKKKHAGQEDAMVTTLGKSKRRTTKLPPFWFRFKMFWYGLYKMFLSFPDDRRQYWANREDLGTREHTPFVMNRKPIMLEDCKKVTRGLNFSFNDLSISVISGAIRQFLLGEDSKRGTKFDELKMGQGKEYLRSVTWVNVGGESFPEMLRQCCEKESYTLKPSDFDLRIGCVWYALPIHVEDDLERLQYAHDILRGLIFSPEPKVSHGVFGVLGSIPAKPLPVIFNVLAGKSSTSFSNVPGPGGKRTLCGMDVERIIFASFPVGVMSEMFHMFSYNGKIFFSVCGKKSKEDMEKFILCWEQSFKRHMELLERDSFIEKVDTSTELLKTKKVDTNANASPLKKEQ